MTTFGFLATNGSSQVLISSKTKNLHFLGKATYYSTLQSSNARGGIRRWTFRIDSTGTPVPFFSVPTTDSYAVVRMTKVTVLTWEIEVVRSGTSSSIPEVYIFTEITSQHTATGAWGMQVFNESGGGLTYDSRLKPLIVKGGTSVIPPYDPLLTSPSGLNPRSCGNDEYAGQFTPDNSSSSVVYNTNVTKPIVSYQSVSQTMREVTVNDQDSHCQDWNFLGICVGRYKYEYWSTNNWTFYRAGISAEQTGTNTYINTGWVPINYGCVAKYDSSTSFGVRGLISVNIGGSSSVAGEWPYNNLTINYRNVPLIVSDGALYD